MTLGIIPFSPCCLHGRRMQPVPENLRFACNDWPGKIWGLMRHHLPRRFAMLEGIYLHSKASIKMNFDGTIADLPRA